MGMRDFTLHDVLARNATLHGGRTAIVFEDQRVTHAQYLARVERLAAGLAAAGLRAGDRFAVMAQNRLEYLDLYGAAARLGAILVPVNWRLSADEVAHVISDTTPVILMADAEYQPVVGALAAKNPSVKRCIALGAAQAGFEPYEGLLAEHPPAPPLDVDADAGFTIMHTAAVGGLPRGAEITHRGLITAHTQMILTTGLGPDDVNLGMLPLFHVSGLGLFLTVLQAGGCTVLSTRFDAAVAARQIQEFKVSIFVEFAPMLGNVLDQAAAQGTDLSSMRVVTGLDTPDTIKRFVETCPKADFWVGFGQSETSGMVTLGRFRDRPGSAGRPATFAIVGLVDDLDRPVPLGTVGEIVVRGPMVFKGYWNRADDNANTFRNGWHHTGDMGRFDADGFLFYAGRSPAKELIKTGGENVYPAEVERVILEHPAIAEVAVIGVRDAQWGEAIKAICACKPGASAPSPAELIEFCGSKIARFKKPKHVVFVAALPRTAAGAIDRAKVKAEHGEA